MTGVEPTPDGPTRHTRRVAAVAALTVLIAVCATVLLWHGHTSDRENTRTVEAARQLCRQVNRLGQACVTDPAGDGVTGEAIIPAPTLRALPGPGTPTPTDEAGVPQAYQPADGVLITAVTVKGGHLILTFSDGTRADAGAVDPAVLAIVLRPSESASPIPTPPFLPLPTPVPPVAPGPTPSTEETP